MTAAMPAGSLAGIRVLELDHPPSARPDLKEAAP